MLQERSAATGHVPDRTMCPGLSSSEQRTGAAAAETDRSANGLF
jgi:hypothetical protein